MVLTLHSCFICGCQIELPGVVCMTQNPPHSSNCGDTKSGTTSQLNGLVWVHAPMAKNRRSWIEKRDKRSTSHHQTKNLGRWMLEWSKIKSHAVLKHRHCLGCSALVCCSTNCCAMLSWANALCETQLSNCGWHRQDHMWRWKKQAACACGTRMSRHVSGVGGTAFHSLGTQLCCEWRMVSCEEIVMRDLPLWWHKGFRQEVSQWTHIRPFQGAWHPKKSLWPLWAAFSSSGNGICRAEQGRDVHCWWETCCT